VVLQAAGGPEALALSRERTGPIHLLLTDVVMPRLGGRELATTLCKERPGLKVLFMSGYSEDPSEERGAFDPSFRLLQKPFTPESLARTVREALDG
jgi:CheY-like chemotaxis protein